MLTRQHATQFCLGLLVTAFLTIGCGKNAPPPAGDDDAVPPVAIAPAPAREGLILRMGERVTLREPNPDVAAGQGLTITERFCFGGRDDKVGSCVFSPDGRRLITAGNRAITIRDLRSGQTTQRVLLGEPGVYDAVHVFALSPDGRTLLARGREDQLVLLNLEDGTRRIIALSNTLRHAVFVSEGRSGFALHVKGVARWDAATGEVVARSPDRTSYAQFGGLAATPDGKTVAVGGSDGSLILLGGNTLQEWKRLPGHAREIHAMALAADGKTLATVARDDAIKLWDIEAGREIRTLKDSWGSLTEVAFSPSGRFLVSAGSSATVWDVASGSELGSLDGTLKYPQCVTFSPDGGVVAICTDRRGGVALCDLSTTLEKSKVPQPESSSLVAAAPGGTKCVLTTRNEAHLWDLVAGKSIRVIPDRVSRAAFSPDGKTLAVCGTENVLAITSTETGASQGTAKVEGEVRVIAFGPDGNHLAVGVGNRVQVLELGPAGWAEVCRSERLVGDVSGLAFAPDGKTLAVGAGCSVATLDVGTGRVAWASPAHEDLVRTVAFSPDGTSILTASGWWRDHVARLWDARTGKELIALRHTVPLPRFRHLWAGCAVQYAFFGMSPGTVVTCTQDGAFHLWDAVTGERLGFRKSHEDHSVPVFSPGREAFLTGQSGTIRVWTVAAFSRSAFADRDDVARTPLAPLDPPVYVPVRKALPTGEQLFPRFCGYSQDGQRLVGIVENGGRAQEQLAVTWDATTGRELHRTAIAVPDIWRYTLSPDGKQLAVTPHDKTVQLRNLERGKELRKFEGHVDDARCVAFSQDGQWLASGAGGFRVREVLLWDQATGRKVRKFDLDSDPAGVAFSPDSTWLVVATVTGGRVFDSATGTERAKLAHTSRATCVAVSRDGRWIALGGTTDWFDCPQDVTVWEASSGKLHHKLNCVRREIEALAFGPDNLLAVTPSGLWDETELWDAATGVLLRRVPRGRQVAISPDGQTLATFGEEGLELIDLPALRDDRLQRAVSPVLALGGNVKWQPEGHLVEIEPRGPDSFAAIAALKDVPGKLSLVLRRTNTPPGAAVRAVSTLDNLRSLTIGSPGLTDSHLRALSDLSRLEELDLRGTGVTEKGIAELRQQLPNTTIETD